MDINSIVSVVSSLGFPVACCGVVGWYVKYLSDKNREQLDKISDHHREEMKEITQALNNNTLAITKLTDFIENGRE